MIPDLAQHQTSLELLDAFCEILIVENRVSVAREVRSKLDYELSIGYVGALMAGLMSVEVRDKNPPILNPIWLSSSSIPDPNLILSSMLGNITNYTLGIMNLIEAGLESQARVNFRILLELSWLALATLSNRDLMLVYAQENSDDEERKIFYKHFSSRKLQQAIAEVESQSGFPEEGMKILSSIRSELYEMYSKQVHNSYLSVVFGDKSFAFEEQTMVYSKLFGQIDMASYPTLYHMNDSIFYFFGMLRRILSNKHALKPPYSPEWKRILSLHECFEYITCSKERHTLGESYRRISKLG